MTAKEEYDDFLDDPDSQPNMIDNEKGDGPEMDDVEVSMLEEGVDDQHMEGDKVYPFDPEDANGADDGDDDDAQEQQEGEKAEVRCSTSKGPILLTLHEDWSPNGYRKATELFERGYYDASHFFRVVPHFLVQFGIGYTDSLDLKKFADSTVADDPKRSDLMPFREGYISFAGSGANSRSSQLFFAYENAKSLGNSPWETPIGEVTEGMENVRNFYKGYGDMPPWGNGPEQGPIRSQGASYIKNDFPLLDHFETCTVKRIDGSAAAAKKKKLAAHHERKKVNEHSNQLGIADETTEGQLLRNSAVKTGMDKDAVKAPQSETLTGKIAPIVIVSATILVLVRLLSRRRKDKVGKNN